MDVNSKRLTKGKDRNIKIVLSTITTKDKYFQLGLYDLKSYLLQRGFARRIKKPNVVIQNFFPEQTVLVQGQPLPFLREKEIKRVANKLVKTHSDVFAFSCFLWNQRIILKICNYIKQILPDAIIILGGPEITGRANIARFPYVDFVVHGEGEKAFSELIKNICFGKPDLISIKGISFKQGDRVLSTKERSLEELKYIPSPFLHLKDEAETIKKTEYLTIETSRGCPFKCAYCSFPIAGKNKVRFFPKKRIIKEIQFILRQRPKNLCINDDNFNLDEVRAIQILQTIKKVNRHTHIKMFINAAVKPINTTLVDLLKETGAECNIGVQSVDSKTLKLIKRFADIRILERNLKVFDNYGIIYNLQFILGLPGETKNNFYRNVNWSATFNPNRIDFFPLMVLRGTDFYLNKQKYGLSSNDDPPYVVKETVKNGMGSLLELSMIHNLLYNQGLLHKTLSYIYKIKKIKPSDIYDKWRRKKIIVVPEVTYLSAVQKRFISYLQEGYSFTNMQEQIIKQLCEEDLKFLKGKKTIAT